jgi:hypothetical protein
LTLQGFIRVLALSRLSTCVTLMAFGIATFVTLLYLQGFVHQHPRAHLAKVIHPPCCACLLGLFLL